MKHGVRGALPVVAMALRRAWDCFPCKARMTLAPNHTANTPLVNQAILP